MNASAQYIFHSGKNSKFRYYMGALFSGLVPDALFHARLDRELAYGARKYDQRYIADRVNYYCQLDHPVPLHSGAPTIAQFRLKGNSSTYFFDSREIVRWFDKHLHWQYLFGDIRDIPSSPTIVKSRSILTDNTNAVLLNLDKCRHFVFLDDKKDFSQKTDRAIFRGQIGNRENRIRFVNTFAGHPRIDAANTLANGGLIASNPNGEPIVPRMSLYQHLDYKYIMALEGNDVASNLKWVMSSNSLAVMPRPTCETWFMEGRLVPNHHYIEVRPDYSDLIEKMDYYTAHADQARQIARNAQAYVAQFRDKRRERYIALRVMQKYFEMTQ